MVYKYTTARSQIESKLEDLNLLLNSCVIFSAMGSIKNFASDLRAEVDTRKTIDHEEFANYMNRLDKMIFNAEKICKCQKRKTVGK